MATTEKQPPQPTPSKDEHGLLRAMRWPIIITLLAVAGGAYYGSTVEGEGGGIAAVTVSVVLLIILEISISFDNAVVNATIVRKLSHFWQQIFLTIGIVIAVFGMRLVFPIAIVAIASSIPFFDVIDLALNDKERYREELESSEVTISAFGGMFLFMVFASFFLDEDKDLHWLGPIERALSVVGRINGIAVGLALLLLFVATQFAPEEDRIAAYGAGIVGILLYLASTGFAHLLEPDDAEDEPDDEHSAEAEKLRAESGRGAGEAAVALTGKAAFASFLYLELLDASFSLDGVIGAFAISTDIIVIAIGLGVGAFYIRELTVFLVRRGTLDNYRFLEHGAHWAIGALAVILALAIAGPHVPEYITGTLGAGMILLAFYWSVKVNRKDKAEGREVGHL